MPQSSSKSLIQQETEVIIKKIGLRTVFINAIQDNKFEVVKYIL